MYRFAASGPFGIGPGPGGKTRARDITKGRDGMARKKKKGQAPRPSVWSNSRYNRGQALENMDETDRQYYYKEIKESLDEKGE